MNIDYDAEIRYRNELKQKIRNGAKITSDERQWLITHAVYNTYWDELTYNTVVESISPKIWLNLIITVEFTSNTNSLWPVISVPAGKGSIKTDFAVFNMHGTINSKHIVKALSFESTGMGKKNTVEYRSELGLLGIEYECLYYDDKLKIYKQELSSSGNPLLAIKRQTLSDHYIRYYCKHPFENDFNALVFTVEWI